MATLTRVVDGVKAYYGVSDQEAPAVPVIVMAAQSAIDAINDIRRYKPVCLIPEPEDDEGTVTSLDEVDENTDETVPEQPGDEETPSAPMVPVTPVIDAWDVLVDQYLSRAVRIAVYLCEKEGVDGVTSFSENGITRSFETGDIPASMLRTVTPICIGF